MERTLARAFLSVSVRYLSRRGPLEESVDEERQSEDFAGIACGVRDGREACAGAGLDGVVCGCGLGVGEDGYGHFEESCAG